MKPLILPREAHTLSRKSIDPEALRVLYGLHRAGYRGYLCGGGVRDLLVGMAPKDFDVATDAEPQQVRKVFRNCRIIGRRFRLAHVFFTDKIVEVSTFRRRAVEADGEADLLIRDDNVFGTPEEDAHRRDFTINGLFYDIGSFAIVDYVSGLADIRERVIRSIGEPSVRFREDPVRMLRAVKLAARLNFAIDAADWEAIRGHAGEILKSAAPRLLDELLKILRGGAAARTFRLMEESGLMDALLPELCAFLEEARAKETGADFDFYRVLEALDEMKELDLRLDNAVFMAALLAPWLVPPRVALGRDAVKRLLDRMEPLQQRLAIGKRDSQNIRNVLVLHHRIRWQDAGKKRPSLPALIRRRALPMAIDLSHVVARSRGEQLSPELAKLRDQSGVLWDPQGNRVALLPGESDDLLDRAPRRRKRRRAPARTDGAKRAPKPAPQPEAGPEKYAMVPPAFSLPADAGGPQAAGTDPPRKRRRRRGGRRRRRGGDAPLPEDGHGAP